MPYGGSDENMQKHYRGVYQSIIAPAVREAGMEPKRSDIGAEPGNITRDIIRDLVESEIVIADLTAANPNVFFELGIRHAFRKSGTVHIADSSQKIPFDIRQYRAIKYSTDLAEIPTVIEQLVEAIKKRLDQPERADNPVHDAIPELPLDIRDTGDASLKKQLKQLQDTYDELSEEKERLVKRLAEIDPMGSFNDEDEIDIDALLDEANDWMESTGQNVLLRLKHSVQNGGVEQFVDELRKVLKSPYLDENDYMEIVKVCKDLGLTGHYQATLELAHKKFPADDRLLLALIDAYDDSPNPKIKERGRLMLESYLSVQHKDGLPLISKKVKEQHNREAVGLLFNFYRRLNKFEWILSVAESASQVFGSESIFERNRASALAALGRADEAEQVFEAALENDPTDDQTISWYADFLDDLQRYEEAYRQFEKAIVADPDDGNLFANLAIHILNRGYVREDGDRITGPLPRKRRVKPAMPLLLRALGMGGRAIVPKIVKVLVRADAVEHAKDIAEGQVPEGEFDTKPMEFLDVAILARLKGANGQG